MRSPPLLLPCLVLALSLVPLPAGADQGHGSRDRSQDRSQLAEPADWDDEDHSYDRARRASERGEILPLSTIYERALARVPGRVLEAELERKHGLWVYELKILDAAGRLLEVYLDASTGALLDHEEED